ncbi:hypothetical protein UFOVP75_74 [uncultured Caudovirales phage]|uniref:Uncharacterized protein n=1 Tax=uncultured Caudovirales phage TaxID=2100421 RepID=A0A6J5L0U1_9CAUD|nr:hypothetical protein UFOVP75_74 [uncultured Caudovirales phage]
MHIPASQISFKKKIGKLGEDPVWELSTHGGYNMVVSTRNGKVNTLGVGPHRAIARHIAMKREPSLVITELSKADHVDAVFFEHLLSKYEAETDQFNAAEKAAK